MEKKEKYFEGHSSLATGTLEMASLCPIARDQFSSDISSYSHLIFVQTMAARGVVPTCQMDKLYTCKAVWFLNINVQSFLDSSSSPEFCVYVSVSMISHRRSDQVPFQHESASS